MADERDDLVRQFRMLDTTAVSDALDRLGIKGGCAGITAQVPGAKAVGRAFTVCYRPCGVEKGSVGDFLDDVQPGQIVVLDNAGRTHCTVWGDIMTVYAGKLGIAGTVIDGVCRDMPRILESKYPIFTRGHIPVTGKDRVELDAVNVPVAVSEVLVRPNDILACDETGVVVIPHDRAAEVLQAAIEIDGVEQQDPGPARQRDESSGGAQATGISQAAEQEVAGTLSGGEKQMLAVARALISRPSLLLLDVPSLGLSPRFVDKVMEMVRKINRQNGTTVIMVEQNAFVALENAHRAYVLENGRIAMTGNSRSLLTKEEPTRAS